MPNNLNDPLLLMDPESVEFIMKYKERIDVHHIMILDIGIIVNRRQATELGTQLAELGLLMFNLGRKYQAGET